MELTAYRQILRSLSWENPTFRYLRQICPHLQPPQIQEILDQSHFFFALPGVTVQGRILEACYVKKDNSARLWILNARKGTATPLRFSEEAIQSQNNWTADLLKADYPDVVRCCLADRSRLDTWKNYQGETCRRIPLVKTLWCVLNRKFHRIVHDIHQPVSQAFDQAIMFMTDDPLESYELTSGFDCHTLYFCSLCGGGWGEQLLHFRKNQSSTCFPDCAYDPKRNRGVPLSQKMLAFLKKANHTFRADPERHVISEKQAFDRLTQWVNEERRKRGLP